MKNVSGMNKGELTVHMIVGTEKSNKEIAEAVKTSEASVAWYRNKVKHGKIKQAPDGSIDRGGMPKRSGGGGGGASVSARRRESERTGILERALKASGIGVAAIDKKITGVKSKMAKCIESEDFGKLDELRQALSELKTVREVLES